MWRRKQQSDEIEWGLATDLGDGWYPLPLDDDPDEFGAHVTETLMSEAPGLVGRTLQREHAEALAAEFVAMTRHAQETGAMVASIFRPEFDQPMVALLQTHVFPRESSTSLAEWGREHADFLGGRHELSETALPIGDAVRIHRVEGPPSGEAEALVVEEVIYLIEAPSGEVIRHSCSWTALASQQLQDLADEIARSLAFT